MTASLMSFAARCALGLCALSPLAAQESAATPQDAADAADAAMKAARERAEADERAARTQLVRESRILFPQRAGKFELQRSARDPEPFNGVFLVYRYGGDIDADVEVSVAPLGRGADDQVMALAARHAGSCANIDPGKPELGIAVVRMDPWTRRAIELQDGRKLPALHRLCSSIAGYRTRVVDHTLVAYRDFYVLSLRVTAKASEALRAEGLVNRAADVLFPRIHVQNIGNCMPPDKPKLVIVDEIDRGADRVSGDGSYLYATKKPNERELTKLLEKAAERRRQTSCVVDFSLASLLPDEKFEILRFPAGSWTQHSPFAPLEKARSKPQQ